MLKYKHMKTIISILIITLYINASAQQLTDSIGNFLIMPGPEIPSNTLYFIESDSKGNIYASSDIGLTKWDGHEWNLYKAKNRCGTIRGSIAIDTNDAVWTITGRYLFKFENNKFIKIGNNNTTHYDVVVSKNNEVYVSISEKLLKIDPITLEYTEIYIAYDDLIYNMQFDNKGNIWGKNVYANKYFEIKNDSVFVHTQLNGVNATNIIALSIIDTNYYAIRTQNGIKHYNNGSYTTINPPITENYQVRNFKYTPDSTLMMASEKGAYIYKNGNWSKIDNYEYAYDICYISPDSIAIAYAYDGISIGSQNSLTNHKGPSLDEIKSLCYYNNILFISGYDGYVSRWDGNGFITNDSTPAFYKSGYLTVSPNNTLYCSGYNGVYKYNNNSWQLLNELYGLPNDVYYHNLDIDDNNTLYVGSIYYGGLYIADSTGLINYYNSSNSPINNANGAIFYDSKDKLWISTMNNSFDLSELYTLENNVFTEQNISNCNGLANSILEDSNGNIWVGFVAGNPDSCSLAKYNGTNWDTVHYESEYFLANGQSISKIYEDYKGNIWLAASYTVYMYDGRQWHRMDKNIEFEFLNQVLCPRSITGDGMGNIYIGTNYSGTYVLSYCNGIIPTTARKLQELTVYPNPSFGNVQLKLKNTGASTILVYNQLGSLVYTTKTFGIKPTVNLSHLDKGQYIINVVQKNNFGTSTIILK